LRVLKRRERERTKRKKLFCFLLSSLLYLEFFHFFCFFLSLSI